MKNYVAGGGGVRTNILFERASNEVGKGELSRGGDKQGPSPRQGDGFGG